MTNEKKNGQISPHKNGCTCNWTGMVESVLAFGISSYMYGAFSIVCLCENLVRVRVIPPKKVIKRIRLNAV